MFIAISLLVFSCWILFGYYCLRPGNKYSVSRRSKNILVLSAVITSMLFAIDYASDKPIQPYTLEQALVELALTGTIYIVIIFFLISAINWIANSLNASK